MATCATTALVVLVVVLLGVGVTAYVDASGVQRSARVMFRDAWEHSSPPMRASLERRFACCGFASPSEYYGPLWSRNCTRVETFGQCCRGLLVTPTVLAPHDPLMPLLCDGTEVHCCYVREEETCTTQLTCADAVTRWARAHLLQLGALAVGFGATLVAAAALFVAATYYISLEYRWHVETLRISGVDQSREGTFVSHDFSALAQRVVVGVDDDDDDDSVLMLDEFTTKDPRDV